MAARDDKDKRGERDGRDEKEGDENPADTIQKLEKRVGINRILTIVVLVVAVSVIAIMATGMTIMFSRIATLEAAVIQDNPAEEQFAVLTEQLKLLADFRKSELKKITAYTKQMEAIEKDCHLDKAEPYQVLLSSREQDFSQLITSVKSGATNLAGMNQGSKAWLDGFTKALDELVARSGERKTKLDTLLEGASNE